MGCDIHMVLERKHGDHWIGVDSFKGHYCALDKRYAWPLATSRNYSRFAALAGVRGDGPDPRGIPDDASELSKLQIADWGQDGHSHSWMSVAEAAPIFYETDSYKKDEFARYYPAAYYFDVDMDSKKLEDYCIVFWFDN